MIIREQTSEAWLIAAMEQFRPWFRDAGFPLPKKIHLSVGFAYGAKAESKNIAGQCWHSDMATDSVNHIFISPAIEDPVEALAVLIHEGIHAALNLADGHKGKFAVAAEKLGLVTPLTSSVPDEALGRTLRALSKELGSWGRGTLHPDKKVLGEDGKPIRPVTGPKKQTTRYHKIVCTSRLCILIDEEFPKDRYTVRMTAKWLDMGYPSCPCGSEMEPED